MELLKTKLHFLDKELLFFSFIAIIFLLVVLNFSDTSNYVSSLLGSDNINIQFDSNNQATNLLNLVSPEVATFVFWAILGLVTFFLINTVYSIFIHPLINDIRESTYVNSKKEMLFEKRLIWAVLIALLILLFVLSIALFLIVAMPYYVIFLGEQDIESFLVLVVVVFMCSMCISLMKSTIEAIVKTY